VNQGMPSLYHRRGTAVYNKNNYLGKPLRPCLCPGDESQIISAETKLTTGSQSIRAPTEDQLETQGAVKTACPQESRNSENPQRSASRHNNSTTIANMS